MPDWHPLLRRQIIRHLRPGDEPEAQVPLEFLRAIDDAYRRSNADLAMVERALELSSQELFAANAYLRSSHDDLERRVQERTEELARVNDKLRHSQKMEAVGRLAGGVAHDFNNLLTVILGQGTQVVEGLRTEDPLRVAAEDIVAAAGRGAQLTRQLLAFGRKQILTPRELDLNELVADADRLLRRLIGANIELVLDLNREPAWILADPGQVEQVIVNLVVNARDAMPDGGRLVLHTAADDTFVKLSVSDTGAGMTHEVMSHIFEPFFTTKELGKGTGLGLATVYGIVEQSGGTIEVESTPGAGTSFTIAFPRVAPCPVVAVRAAPVVDNEVVRGSETILLVEDEPGVRGLAMRVLSRAGYHVLAAADGQEALDLYASWSGPLDLVLSDVTLPNLSGPETVKRLRALRPGLRVIFMSGYVDEALMDETLAMAPFVQKPFVTDELRRLVRQVLNAPIDACSESPQTLPDPRAAV
jgi:two-component system, cell cycle sensor histidine kinase and response regulator CckA